MESHAKFLGHPVHPMLIVFPLGLLATAVIFDIIGIASGAGQWHAVAYYMIPAGIIGGLVAAVFGLVDWLVIPKGTRARAIGAYHALINVAVLALFAISWSLRIASPSNPTSWAFVWAFVGAVLALASGWLGGELVDRLGIGVDEGAHVNAPSSLRR
jgi:uncharacterized membrane protein